MYFNGKTYFNQDTNMRVVGDQRNPPPRRKGVKRKKVKKKKDGKVDMKKLKSLFGSDIIVKLLLSLVDKKSQGPNLKKEGKKVQSMRRSKGANFQSAASVKKDRLAVEKAARVEKATQKAPGETDVDVLNRLIKEVAVGGDPASLAYLKANTIPPELRNLIGQISVLGEAYFDKNLTPDKKKTLERTIIKQVVEGIGGDVRKEFIKTSKDDDDILEGFKEGVEALKKQGFTNAETIIQKKDEIEKKLTKRKEKTISPKEVKEIDKALTGLEVVLFTNTVNTENMEKNLTEEIIDDIQKKRGRKAVSEEDRIKIIMDFATSKKPELETEGDNRSFFLNYVQDGINAGNTNAQIKQKLSTQIKNLEKGKNLQNYSGEKKTEGIPKQTRADAGIFAKGAVANEPTKYNIELPDGTTQLFDGNVVNPKIKDLNKQIDRYTSGNNSKIGTRKQLLQAKRDLKVELQLFRDQLSRRNKGETFEPEKGYSLRPITIDENLDTKDLSEQLMNEGYFLPDDINLDKSENIVGIGQEGITIKSDEGFIRYENYDQNKFRKEKQSKEKADAVEKKKQRQMGIKPSEQNTDVNKLIENLPNKDRYRTGELTDIEVENLPPRLIKDYPNTKKLANKERKIKKKADDEAAKTALSTGIGGGKLNITGFGAGEGSIFNTETGAEITQEDIAEDRFSMFDAIDEGGEEINEDQADQLQDNIQKTTYLEDMTDQQIAEIQAQPEQYDEKGNLINPIDYIPKKPLTDVQKQSLTKSKRDTQAELLEKYKTDKSVLNKINIAGRKKLTARGEYTLTPQELESMTKKERTKYEKVIVNRQAITDSQYGEGGKKEADELLLLRNQGKELTSVELNKISYADRKTQGLLTEDEVKKITDSKDRKNYLKKKKVIDKQIEDLKVKDRREIIGDIVLEGSNFDRIKEQAEYFGQSRQNVYRQEVIENEADSQIALLERDNPSNLPDFAFRGDTYYSPRSDTPPREAIPPRKSNTPPRQSSGGGGVDNSINEMNKQLQSLQSFDAAGPKKDNRKKEKNIPEELRKLQESILGRRKTAKDSESDDEGEGVGFIPQDDDAPSDDDIGGDYYFEP